MFHPLIWCIWELHERTMMYILWTGDVQMPHCAFFLVNLSTGHSPATNLVCPVQSVFREFAECA